MSCEKNEHKSMDNPTTMETGAQDIILVCQDCSEKFMLTVEEQKFFTQKGWSFPKRCKQCRLARKNIHAYLNKNSSRQTFEIICAECGKKAQVPFRPIKGRPVYCNVCYQSLLTSRRKM